MVIAVLQVFDKLGCSWFFQKTFLLANINVEVFLGILFLTFNNVDIQFAEKKLTWRIYTTKKALSTTCRVELIHQKKFAKAALDENIEAFMMYVSSLGLRITIYLARMALMALLLAKKVTILAKYSDFANVFLEKSANVLSE